MATGSVKWFNSQKGFGFIVPDDNSKDVFVHVTALERAGIKTLAENQRVDYEIETHKGKTSAINIKVLS